MRRIDEIFPDGHWANEDEYVIRCPICGDHKTHDHCYLSLSKKLYNCYHCGAGGKLDWFVRRYGDGKFELEPRKGIIEKKKHEGTDFAAFPKISKTGDFLSRMAHEYLTDRGIPDEEIRRYDIRYGSDGRYYGRVIVPLVEKERIVCFSARSFLRKIKPKYLYPHHGETLLTTGESFFGFDEARSENLRRCVLVEGVFDAMAVNRKDPDSVGLAIMSKAISKGQLFKLYSMERSIFYIMLDSDAHKDAVKIARQIHDSGRNVRICFLDEGDPDTISEEELVGAIEISQPYSLSLETEIKLRRQKASWGQA